MDNLISFLGIKIDLANDGITLGGYLIKKESVYNFGFKVVKILLIIILMIAVIKIGNSIINRMVERQKNFKFSLDEKKSQTLGLVLQSILRYTVYFVGVFGILEAMFGTIGLTLAGMGGVAVGFGAQSLIKDIINGFFILFEDQYSVGDYITVENMGGIVESIELRITKLRDFNGDLHTIPNGLITKVTNHSRGNIRVTVDVDISYSADLDKALSVISDLCLKFNKENEDMAEGPEVLGISALKESGITIRIAGKAKPMTQWSMEMKLRKEVRDRLKYEGIEMPYPAVKLIKE